MADLWLAVDGGQTATIAVLASSDGQIRAVGRGGPLRNEADPDAEPFARQAIDAAVGDVLLGVSGEDAIVVACLALTGSEGFVEAAVRERFPSAEVIVLENDALAVMAAGTRAGGGIGLVAGTGSVAVAMGRSGTFVRRGGWGWLLGDEGSGYWIGREALRAAAREADEAEPSGALTAALLDRLGLIDVEGVRDAVTGGRVDRAGIAALAPLVVDLADRGDQSAAAILEDAACRLSDLATAVIAGAPFLDEDERLIVAGGGVLEHGGRVAERVAELLATAAPGFRFVIPEVPPVVGALYLGLARRGVTVDDATHARALLDSKALDLWRKAP